MVGLNHHIGSKIETPFKQTKYIDENKMPEVKATFRQHFNIICEFVSIFRKAQNANATWSYFRLLTVLNAVFNNDAFASQPSAALYSAAKSQLEYLSSLYRDGIDNPLVGVRLLFIVKVTNSVTLPSMMEL